MWLIRFPGVQRKLLSLFAVLLLCCAQAAVAQTCGVPGFDGAAAPTGVINTYHAGVGTGSGNAVTVASLAGQRTNTRALRAGDLILIMQMQDGTTPASAGRHEYAQVTSVSGTTLNLNRTLTNSYARSLSTTGAQQTWQVIWVPQYASAAVSGTVSADRWTVNATSGDSTGGVVAMDVAGGMTLTGVITAAGSGFRGGAGINGGGNRAAGATYLDANQTVTVASMNGGIKGEGIEGTPIQVFDGTATPPNYATLLGQGYNSGGAGGRGPRSNAGGAGNDGDPTGAAGYGGNQLNSGGAGGAGYSAGGGGGNSWNQNMTTAALNGGATANVGNPAGGVGGVGQVPSASRLPMGGGGGSGTANNGSGSSVTTFPPTASGAAANGAAGSITSSGASGGGVVLVRAGTFAAPGGVVDASGYRAYNKAPVGDTDSAGGGGGGGSVSIRAVSGSGTGLSINVQGGDGGSSNYFNHGPGGGGGGGYVLTTFPVAGVNLAGGTNGIDGCCGGTNGNGSPKAWNSSAGTAGAAATADGTTLGVNGGASCLPVVNVAKSTTTPAVTAANGASATYSIHLSNTGGAATNLFVFDASLPPGWAYAAAPPSTYIYSASPAAGAQTGPATLPAGLPANTALTVSTGTVALGSTPGTVPSTGNNSLTFGAFYLPQNASITITFAATIPDTATVGTYHNPAGVVFLDPTRTAASGNRLVSPAVNVNANRTATSYSANTTYDSGATTTVGGTNTSGLANGPAAEDITLLADLSVSKTGNSGTFTIGAPGALYVIVARNNGRAIADQVFASTQATDVSATAVASSQLSLTDTLPAGMTVTSFAVSNSPTWACAANGTSTTFTCSAGSGVYPLPAATNIVTVTATVAVSVAACPGPLVNTVTFTVPATGDTSTANNTGTSTTAIGCSANLTVSKTDNATSVLAGGTTSYTVTFSNLGPAAANGATVNDAAGAGLSCTVANCIGAGGAACPAAGVWPNLLASSLPITPFPSGSSATFIVNCNVTATGL